MKQMKIISLLIGLITTMYLIYESIQKENLILAAALCFVLLVISYLGLDLKIKSFSFDLDDKSLEVNKEDKSKKEKK